MTAQQEVIDFLSHPESYGASGPAVEIIETHGSLIFLHGERAYKLKRAIAYAALDFLTLTKRERACHAELRLNGRTGAGHLSGSTLDYPRARRPTGIRWRR